METKKVRTTMCTTWGALGRLGATGRQPCPALPVLHAARWWGVQRKSRETRSIRPSATHTSPSFSRTIFSVPRAKIPYIPIQKPDGITHRRGAQRSQAREVAMKEVKTMAKDALVSTGLLMAQKEIGARRNLNPPPMLAV